ncbi:GlyGly-CTERM sorting domain-containing protein [Alteromonas sp. ASW11-19]|uniref:GlyGly-CTERM sorting domain-containing protein n=2 Tax=Alteromonas salexigens TaxID=2982530 RepID=A0ABT2VLJ7_9ALTE|nr:GlyGly-CTERM sorting domain-containing protein [Alteromonas salexigens]
MDETDDNYSGADPALGGEPRTLNIPSITDNNCVGRCSWKRTVTATKDGSWSVEGVSISEGLSITVTPATFDLAAGESQELTIDIDAFGAESDVWSFGSINLTSSVSPDLHLPVSIVASNGNIPDSFDFKAHRNQDSYLIEDVMAVEITNFQSVSYGLTKATLTEGSVTQDSDNSDYLDDLEDGLSITTVEVPENAVRLTATTMESTSPDLDLFIVHDVNGDGIPQEEEVVGFSASASAEEYVNVEMPEAGNYWIIVQNWSASSEGATDTFTLAHALVDSEPGDGLSIEAPSAVPQLTEFDMRLTWDLDDASEGDIFFGAIALGTDEENATNLGVIPVDIVRGMADVYVTSPTTERVNPGDTQEFAVNVMANFTPEDRIYDVSLTLPEGVTLVEGSVSSEGIVDGDTISWTVEQESLLGVEPTYTITTNATDAMCMNPEFGQGNGGYIDLAGFGIGFSALDGDTVDATFSIPGYFLGELYGSMTVTDDGFITFGNGTGSAPWINQNMPDSELPNGVVAPYWRDQELDVANGSGVSVATAGPNYTIVEWDNMKFYGIGDSYADIADYQVVFVNNATESQPNIIYSYTDVEHELGAVLPVSIGYENATGTAGQTPIYSEYSGSGAAGDFETTIVEGAQFCMYLNDVSDAPTQLTFSVTVDENNTGGPIQMMAMSEVTNIPGAGSAVSPIYEGVQVEGPPQVTIDGEVEASLEVVELRELPLPGLVVEPNGDKVDITWKQVGGPPAVIAGNGLQEAILMAPEVEEDTLIVLELTAEDSNGNEATAIANVMVKNNLPPEISVTAPTTIGEGETITITASATDPENDNVTFTINGVPGSTYSTSAPGTNSETTVAFEVVASDGLNTTTETVSVIVTDKSGGSMGWLALLLVPVAFLRRRKFH